MEELTFSKKMEILTAPIENPKWRIQSKGPKTGKKTFCIVVPYVDARMVQERFDKAFGAENWENTYDPESGSASISVRIDGEWVTKSDVGIESQSDGVKGKASDAFKRAAVLWGVGRDLYLLGQKSLHLNDKEIPISQDGSIELRTPTAISNYMNKLSESVGLLYQIWNLNKNLQVDDNFKDLIGKLKDYVK
jgi:hypothetical protein